MVDVTLKDLVEQQRITNTILRAAFRPQLNEIVEALSRDPVYVAVVDELAESEKSAGDLIGSVGEKTALKERAVQERLLVLVEDGVILREGGGRSTTYRMGNLLSNAQLARVRSAAKSRSTNGRKKN